MVQRKIRGARDSRRQAVIFDFDGTISDSFEYVFDFLNKEAGKSGVAYSKADLRDFRGMSMRRLALHLGVPVWRMPVTYFRGRRVMRAHMEDVRPFDGMVNTIRRLHKDGYELFIASSNSGHNIRHLLRREGILSEFKAIRGSAGLTGKPALIRQLLVRYRLPRQTVWYVGDELGDVTAAARAGVRSLAVGWGFADPKQLRGLQPDGFAEKPADIVGIIEESWKK